MFNLASGCHQIEFDPKDRQKKAFSSLNGHDGYVTMPMGLKNLPVTFQHLMDQALLGLQGTELFVYLDDMVIFAKDLEDHGKNIRRLLKQLKEANLPLQPETPRNIKQFLGLAGYYRRFIKDFAARAKALSNLLKREALCK